jgi:hypothetical protein
MNRYTTITNSSKTIFLNNRWFQKYIFGALLTSVIVPVMIFVFAGRPLVYSFDVTLPPDIPVSGISPVEISEKGPMRWFGTTSDMAFPLLSRSHHLLELEVHGGGVNSRTLEVWWNKLPYTNTVLRAGWNRLTFLIPETMIRDGENVLSLTIDPLPPFQQEKFGIAVTQLHLRQLDEQLAPVQLLIWLSGICFVVYLWAIVLQLSPLEQVLFPSIIGGVIGFGIATIRLQMAALLPWVVGVAVFVTGLFALFRFGIWWRRQTLSVWFARLLLVVVVWFGIHVVGMNAPVFIDIDHRARANHVLLLAHGAGDIVQSRLSNQYEWGIATVPYSLLSYYPFVPLAFLITETYEFTIVFKCIISFINATIPLFLYWISVRTGYGKCAGFFAGALFVGFPVTHLYFHDGSYPTILGVWWMVLTLAVMNELALRGRWSWQEVGIIGGLICIALLIYVTHIVFVPLVIGVASLLAIYRGDHHRGFGIRVLIALLIAMCIAVIAYYGRYLVPTVMAVFERLTTGERVGYEALPSPLVGSLVEQLWGHVRFLPIFLTPLALFVIRQRGITWMGYILIGYVVLLLGGIIIDQQFSLWNKHWYFSLPALALLGGIALDVASNYRFGGKWLVGCLIGYLLFESMYAWFLRVFLYQWSLRTL